MRKIIIVIVLMSAAALLFAQGSTFINPDLLRSRFQQPSVINLDNLDINHSISFSAGASSSGEGFYQSRYTNHLRYKISEKLKLNVDLNFLNFGTMSHDSGVMFSGNEDNTSQIVPEFSLEYNPSDNTRIIFEYRQYDPYSWGSSSYRDRRW